MAAAAASPSSLSPTDLDNTALMLRCPINFEAYSEENKAVSLVARGAMICGHTVSERAARALLATRRPCPLCRVEIVDCIPNPLITQLACTLLTRSEDAIPVISAKIKVGPEVDIAAIPFPGKGAHFEVTRKWWTPFDDETSWGMEFESRIMDSFFTAFTVFGKRNGQSILSIYVDVSRRDIYKKYGKDCGVHKPTLDWIDRPNDVKKAFCILATHNQICEPEFSLLRRLIQENVDWRTIERELGLPEQRGKPPKITLQLRHF